MKKREAVIVGVADIPLQNGKVTESLSVLQVQARAARDVGWIR